MHVPLTQYVFCIIRHPDLPLRLIIDISHIIHVYISHICGRHHSELSGSVPVIVCIFRVQKAFPYQLGNVMIVSQTCNDLVLLTLGLIIAPNVNYQI